LSGVTIAAVSAINPEAVDATTEEVIARQKTQDDLADRRHFLLSTEKYEEFLNLLDWPAQPKPGLERPIFKKGAVGAQR